MKYILDGTNRRPEIVKEKTRELEDTAIEIIHHKTKQGEKTKKKKTKEKKNEKQTIISVNYGPTGSNLIYM